MRVITDQQVAATLGYAEVGQRIAQAFEALQQGRAAIKPRQRIDCGAVKLSSMGAVWLDAGLAGEKVYPTVEGRFGFVFNLFSLRDGRPLAVLDGAELTRVRTAAMTTLAVARGAAAFGKLALFGAGLQGRAHLEALLGALPFQRVDVVDPQDLGDWPRAASMQHRVAVRQCSAAEAVADADVVVTITRSKTPVFDGAWLKPGAFVAAVGTSLPTGRELDDTTLERAARVVVEWLPQSRTEAGEVVLGLQSGALQENRLTDLLQLGAGGSAWRQSPEEIVVFKSVGVGLTDLAAAAVVWERLGQDLI
jgi:ornithine cyclodeaminase